MALAPVQLANPSTAVTAQQIAPVGSGNTTDFNELLSQALETSTTSQIQTAGCAKGQSPVGELKEEPHRTQIKKDTATVLGTAPIPALLPGLTLEPSSAPRQDESATTVVPTSDTEASAGRGDRLEGDLGNVDGVNSAAFTNLTVATDVASSSPIAAVAASKTASAPHLPEMAAAEKFQRVPPAVTPPIQANTSGPDTDTIGVTSQSLTSRGVEAGQVSSAASVAGAVKPDAPHALTQNDRVEPLDTQSCGNSRFSSSEINTGSVTDSPPSFESCTPRPDDGSVPNDLVDPQQTTVSLTLVELDPQPAQRWQNSNAEEIATTQSGAPAASPNADLTLAGGLLSKPGANELHAAPAMVAGLSSQAHLSQTKNQAIAPVEPQNAVDTAQNSHASKALDPTAKANSDSTPSAKGTPQTLGAAHRTADPAGEGVKTHDPHALGTSQVPAPQGSSSSLPENHPSTLVQAQTTSSLPDDLEPDGVTTPKSETQPMKAIAAKNYSPVQVQAARLIQSGSQVEMRVGLRTETFGAVQVHASVSDKQVQLALGSERGDLRSSVTADLPVLQSTLQQHDLRLDQVRTVSQVPSGQLDFFSGSGGQQQGFRPPEPGSTPATYDSIHANQDEEMTEPEAGLSIRV